MSRLEQRSDLLIDFNNDGRQAAVFHARSANPADLPQCYTVEPHQSLTGSWALATNRTYDLSVHGPNGFFRSFKGRQSNSSATLRYGVTATTTAGSCR